MNTSENLPTQRSPEQAPQQATAPSSAHPATYPVPENLTPLGLRAFRSEVTKFATAIAAELAKNEDEVLSRGGQPEHTAEAVTKARQEYVQRLRSMREAAEHKAHHDRSVLAVILVTAAIVGLNVMQNFLHSRWQLAVFVLFVLVGLAGLVVTWAGRQDWDGDQHPTEAAHPFRVMRGRR